MSDAWMSDYLTGIHAFEHGEEFDPLKSDAWQSGWCRGREDNEISSRISDEEAIKAEKIRAEVEAVEISDSADIIGKVE